MIPSTDRAISSWPEDIVVTCLTVTGAFIILLKINVALTLIVFLFLPVMAVYALYFNKKMNRALRSSKDRIGDINAQVEDTLAGIRVVKSFTNEDVERQKVRLSPTVVFSPARRDGYRSEAYFSSGLIAFTQLITIAVIIFGGVAIVHASLDLADLVTYLLICRYPHRSDAEAGQFCQALSGRTHRIQPVHGYSGGGADLQDALDAVDLTQVQGHVGISGCQLQVQRRSQLCCEGSVAGD